jgi:Pvc16 N-terminal domain
MINDLDSTLRVLLNKGLPSALADQVQVSFATPDDQFPPQSVMLPAIDFFLYDIRENLELRSNEVFLDYHGDGSVTQTPAPVRIDFSYLITAWPSESVQVPCEDEHHLLGEVMRVLLRYKHIPQNLLQGELAGQEPSLPVISLQPGRLQSLGEFWQALGGKPKVALNLQVTISVAAADAEKVDLVTEKIIKIRMEQGVAS